MQLQKTYDSKGKIRCYRKDAEGREYLWYFDQATRIIVRVAMVGDEKKVKIAFPLLSEYKIKKAIQEIDEVTPNLIIMFETKSKFLGCAETFTYDIEEGCAKMRIYMKNEVMRDMYFEKVEEAVRNLCKKHLAYKEITVDYPVKKRIV